tara:strand:- start:213 stop:776 length:564 start_codon:yes stop_codon:yes gene_type:complete
MNSNNDFPDKDKESTNEELDEELGSDNNSSNSENLTSSMLSLNNDLNSSTISINEEENNLLNNYKYSSNEDINLDITIENFIKLTQNQPEIILMISNARKNISLLPELLKNIKLYDHKLSLNLMDNPGYCFDKIFDILFNKSDNIEDHMDSIQQILDIFPMYSQEEIFDIFKTSNYNIDLTIEKICY